MKKYYGDDRISELARRQTRQMARKIAKRKGHKLEKSKLSGWWVIDKNNKSWDNRPQFYGDLYEYVLDNEDN